MRRRVVITGMGAVTPLGLSVDDLYRNQLEGRSGVGPISLFDASKFPTKFAAEVKGFELGKYVRNPQALGQFRSQQLVSPSPPPQQAVKDAGLVDDSQASIARASASISAPAKGFRTFTISFLSIAESYRPTTNPSIPTVFTRRGMSVFNAEREYEQELHTTPGHLAEYFDLRRAQLQLPDRLCGQQPGPGRGDRDDSRRRGRPDAVGRFAQHDPSLRRHRLQPAHRPVDPQRSTRKKRPGRST